MVCILHGGLHPLSEAGLSRSLARALDHVPHAIHGVDEETALSQGHGGKPGPAADFEQALAGR